LREVDVLTAFEDASHRLLREVSSEHLRRLHRRMKRTPVEANRTLTALSAVFGWADRTELLPGLMNPCRYVERYAEKGERRAFTADELAALGAAMDEAKERKSVHPSALLTIRLLALTGFRRSELLGHMVKVRRGEREGLRWGVEGRASPHLRVYSPRSLFQTARLWAWVWPRLRTLLRSPTTSEKETP
jgi:integrase